ncbi:MAG: hypothetical protein A2142_04095 [candidate division Zixibacteria bacterium RBG_16_48_11]|nr:MAG: hypothetical protein A2142_04095 [candidate division Zixibacteria bacterium RBG_16_48_11]
MRGRLLLVVAVLVLAVPGLLLAKGIDLYSLFPNLTLGADPSGTDSVYLTCAAVTATTVTMKVHVVTENGADPNDALAGIDIELQGTADQGGVTLDTTVATVYGGSAVVNWGYLSVFLPGGNPGSFPLDIKLGAVELDTLDDPLGQPLGAGDHVFATLKFNISSPTNISANGTTISSGPATLVTNLANGYSVAVSGETCGPFVPTLSEWGLILFGVVLFGSLVWYLRRRPITAAA